jgi:chromosome segregation ATPase
VLNIHLHMIRSRCELFETLKLAGQEFDNTQQEALTAFGQADVVIGQAKTNVSDGYQTMQAAEKRAADAFALLQGQCSSFLADCKECQQRIQQANRQLTEQYDLNRNIANELEQGTTQVEKDLGPLNQLRREIEETKRKLARLQGEVDDVKQQKERHQGALAKAKQKLADLQAERGRKKEEIADLERQTHQTEAQFRGTNEQVAKLEKFLDKLREAAKSAPAQRAKFVDSVNQLEELLQHRPSTIGRVKASWQFLKALRTAPRGFFPNEAGSHPQGGTPNAGT